MTIEEIIAAEQAEAMAQVVTPDGKTRGQLKAAFDRVCNPKNWKLPILWVGIVDDDERSLISEAIEFFTGSRAVWHAVYGSGWYVRAAGYYQATGGA